MVQIEYISILVMHLIRILDYKEVLLKYLVQYTKIYIYVTLYKGIKKMHCKQY